MSRTLAFHRWILDAADQLPHPPTLVQSLVAAASDPASDVEVLSGIAMQDPVLVGHILREANSVAYSTGGIDTMEKAVMRLGSARLIAVAVDGLMGDGLQAPLAGYGMEAGALHRHAMATCHAVVSCIRLSPEPIGREIVVAALLHDLGKTIINPLLDPLVDLRMVEHDWSFITLEQEAVATDHLEVGAFILESWDLPKPVIEAVRNHHEPNGDIGAQTLCVADWIGHLAIGVDDGAQPPPAFVTALDSLGLTEKLDSIVAEVVAVL